MYKLGGGNRQQLMHSMITDPFTDEQLDWTLTEISKVRSLTFISRGTLICGGGGYFLCFGENLKIGHVRASFFILLEIY